MILFYARPTRNPSTKTNGFSASITAVSPVSLNRIVERIQARCTVNSADIKACLDALQAEVLESIMDGKSVRLGDLGSFRPVLSSKFYANAEDVDANSIKSVRVRFTPSVAMRSALSLGGAKKVAFRKVSTVVKDETVTE